MIVRMNLEFTATIYVECTRMVFDAEKHASTLLIVENYSTFYNIAAIFRQLRRRMRDAAFR